MGVSQGCMPSGGSGEESLCPSCPPVVAGIPGLLDASLRLRLCRHTACPLCDSPVLMRHSHIGSEPTLGSSLVV